MPQGTADPSDQVLAAARNQGREQGYAEGKQQALAEQAELKTKLIAALEDLSARRDGLAKDFDDAVTDLIFGTLQALLRVELVTNPQVIANLVAEGLDVLNVKLDTVSVRAHPQDVDWLPSMEIEVTADATVPLGGLAVAVPDLCVEFDLLAKLRDLRQWHSSNAQDQDGVHEPSPREA